MKIKKVLYKGEEISMSDLTVVTEDYYDHKQKSYSFEDFIAAVKHECNLYARADDSKWIFNDGA